MSAQNPFLTPIWALIITTGVGIGTIAGGAASNFFPTLAWCILIPTAAKKIENLEVFILEAFWATWAYVWLYIVSEVRLPWGMPGFLRDRTWVLLHPGTTRRTSNFAENHSAIMEAVLYGTSAYPGCR